MCYAVSMKKSKRDQKVYHSAWYQAHKDDPGYKERAKAYRLVHRDKINLESANWKETHTQSHLLSNAKYRAKRKGLEFNLEITDMVIPEYCPYLGIKLTSDKLKGHLDSHMSVDRIDPTKGYIKGNIEIISYRANTMKQNASKEQLIMFAENVLRKFKENNNEGGVC